MIWPDRLPTCEPRRGLRVLGRVGEDDRVAYDEGLAARVRDLIAGEQI